MRYQLGGSTVTAGSRPKKHFFQENDGDVASEAPSEDSQSMGLMIPTGYLMPTGGPSTPHKNSGNRSPQAAGETTHEEQRLVMLAKDPNATDESVAHALFRQQQLQEAQAIKRQQQQQFQKVQQQQQHQQQQQQPSQQQLPSALNANQKYSVAFVPATPIDNAPGAWKQSSSPGRGKQEVDHFAANLRSSQDQDFEEVWKSHGGRTTGEIQQLQTEESPPSFFISILEKIFPSMNDASNHSLDGAGTLASEKTRKISNVDEVARAKRIRRENGELTFGEKVQKGWDRLTKTRNGIILLCLLLILVMAIIVTVAAALASQKARGDSSQSVNQNELSTIIPRPQGESDSDFGNPSLSPSPSPSPIEGEVSDPNETGNGSSPDGGGISTPSRKPTPRPTKPPTKMPTKMPTKSPTEHPTSEPTREPTKSPTKSPTSTPTTSPPTSSPTVSPVPTIAPTVDFLSIEFEPVGDSIEGSQSDQRFGHSTALSKNGQIMAVGAPLATIEGNSQAGMVQVYELRNNNWVTRGPALVGRNSQDQFGSAIALSEDGSVLVASEPTFRGSAGDRSGNVRVFVYGPSNRYEPLGDEIEGEAATDHFGVSVSVSNNGRRLAVGAPYHDNGGSNRNVSGRVTIFEFKDNEWKALGQPLPGDNHLDWFGWDVDLNDAGTVLAVGAPRNLAFGGYVNCYRLQDDEWVQIDKIIKNKIQPLRYDDNFGHTVKLSGDNRVAIGSPGKNNAGTVDSGQVTVYELNDKDQWKLLGSAISTETPQANDQMGLSVDLYRDVLAVGVPGRAQVELYKYDEDSDSWNRHPIILEGPNNSNYGYSIRYTPAALAVGTALTSGDNTGLVNVYQID